jgi:hypothetical protein
MRKVRIVYQIFARISAGKSGCETGFSWLRQDTVEHSNTFQFCKRCRDSFIKVWRGYDFNTNEE